MDYFGFVVSAAGEIEDGPDGWTCSLSGVTYTVTHDSGVVLVPAVDAINDGVGLVVSQLTDVGPNSFSWTNQRELQGADTTRRTAVRIAVAATP